MKRKAAFFAKVRRTSIYVYVLYQIQRSVHRQPEQISQSQETDLVEWC